MKNRLFALVGCLALAPGLLATTQEEPEALPTLDQAATDGQIAADWRLRLTDPDLDVREQELDRFLSIAREDRDARALLEDWAEDQREPELAWTARLALRQLGSAGAASGPRGGLAFGPGLSWRADPFAGRHSDPFAGLFGSSWDDMQGELERLRSMFDEAARGAPLGAPGSTGNHSQSSQGFQLSVTPEGAKATVREQVDGVEQVQEYEAASLEELLQANPELRGRVATEGSLSAELWSDSFPTLDRFLQPRQRSLGKPLRSVGPQELRTDVLGVYLRPLGDEDAARLGVAPGAGLVVLRTEPGTIAAALGIQRGHVLLEVNGVPATGRDAVSQALCERPDDGEVNVELIDNWGQRRTRTWRPQEELEETLRRGLLGDGKRF